LEQLNRQIGDAAAGAELQQQNLRRLRNAIGGQKETQQDGT
jgi:hypothetical protein